LLLTVVALGLFVDAGDEALPGSDSSFGAGVVDSPFVPSFQLALGVHEARAATVETAEEQSKRALDITRTTMSPFCPGRTIDACPSPYATQWREDIRTWVGEGVPTEEIRRRLKQRVDQDLTGAPSTVLDAVLPAMVVVISLLVLILLLRALLSPRASSPAPAKAGGKKNLEGAQNPAGPPNPEGPQNLEGMQAKGTRPKPVSDTPSLDRRIDDELSSLDQ
jgi:cytochrome c-type biogenesis protein CcmH/NrfF